MFVETPHQNGSHLVALLFALCLLLFGAILPSYSAAATLDIPVTSSNDDAEERTNTASPGTMVLTSTDLEMPWDSSKSQQMGMRFQNVSIPPGATITNANIQFTVDRADRGGLVSLTIKGEKTAAPSAFSNTNFNISSRARTNASVSWSPPSWTVVNAAGVNQSTPDLSGILQEVIDQPGWLSGNPTVILIEDNGSDSRAFRAARTFNGSPAGAPVLHVEYTTQPTVETPTITPNGGTFENAVSVTLDTTTAGAVIHYTLDGNDPTTSSDVYSSGSPIQLTTSATVKAAAFLTGYIDSAVATAVFSIDWPTTGWLTATPAEVGMDSSLLDQARAYALTGGGSGFITRGGKLVMSWGDPQLTYDLKSSTKSIGVSMLGLALQDGVVALNDVAQLHLPDVGNPPTTNVATGWLDDITLEQLATHTAGFEKDGGFGSLLYQPGTTWSYSDGGANWLADLLTVTYGDDLNTVLFSRLFSKLGITTTDLIWRNNSFRDDTINGIKRREFGSGISANVDAMARIGYLYLRGGIWDGTTILPQSFVDQVGQYNLPLLDLPVSDPSEHFNATDHYGLHWWNNADGSLAGVPTDAYWSWGLGDSLIIVIPSLDIVVSRAGNNWRPGWNSDYSILAPFLQPIVQSVTSVSGNLAPVANDDSFNVDENSTNNPLAVFGDNGNGVDSDPDLDPISIINVVTPDAGGSAVPNATNDALIYSPLAGYAGVETFKYTIADGNGGINTATVSVLVGSGNIPPTAVTDTLTVNVDTQGSVDVLTNDSNGGDGGPLSVTAFDAISVDGGTVDCVSTGLCTYMPTTGFSGSDSFTYTVSDGLDTAVGLVSVNVTTIGGGGFQQDGNGLVSMEAENYLASVVSSDGHEWLSAGTGFAGYSGTDSLRALPDDNVSNGNNYTILSPRLDYQVNFTQTGTHYVWIRMQGPSSSSDTVHVGLDEQEVGGGKNIRGPVTGGYVWTGAKANGSRATMDIGAGLHTVNVWMRESGTVVDKVVLTTDPAFDPSTINGGLGPTETLAPPPPEGDLAVTKTVDNAAPGETDTIVYTVTVTNNGPDDATGIMLSDGLPSGVTYVSDDAAGAYTGGVWTVGALANAASATLNITATVDAGTGGTTITNTANISASEQADPNATNNSAAVDITVAAATPEADLAVTKTVDNAAPDEDGTIVYTVTITNNGPLDATGVTLSDALPSGVTYVSDDAAGAYAGGVWTVGALANAASATLNITATVDAGTGGTTITNTASISASEQADPNGTNNSASVDVIITPPSSGGEFLQDGSGLVSMEAENYLASVVSSDGHEWLSAGAGFAGYSGADALRALPDDNVSNGNNYAVLSPRLDYQVNFTQTGTHYVWVRMQGPSLSSDTVHVGLDGQGLGSSKNIRGPVTGGYVWASAKANGSRATMDIGAGAHTVNLWMSETGTVIDKVVLTTDPAFDPSTINGGLGPNETLATPSTDADLSMAKTVDNSTPLEGDTVIYTVSVTNNGPSDTSGVSVTDLLPAELIFVGDNAAASGTFYDSATGTWTVGTLTNGQAATLQITTTVAPGSGGSTLTNTASVMTSNQADPVSGNNSAAVDITVATPANSADLSVSKSVDNTAPAEGDTIVYTVTVTNNGLLDATGVNVTDILPVGLSYISDDAAASGTSYDSVSGLWIVGALTNGQTETLNISATVDAGTGGDTLVNTASVSGLDQVDPDGNNDSASVDLIVAPPSGGGGFQQDETGLVSMEAENYLESVVSSDGHEWLSAGTGFAGYSGTDALRALPDDNVSNGNSYAVLSPRLDYQVNFTQTGTHYVWVRMLGPSLSSDTVHVGLDGQGVSGGKNVNVLVTGDYAWASVKGNGARATMEISAGAHTINVWMSETGTVIDKVVLTTDPAFDPSTINGGLGPDETGASGSTVESPAISPNGGVFANPVNVSLSTSTAGATIYYTEDGSVPTTASTEYTAPFQVAFDKTVKARAFLTGYNDSAVSSAVFQINSQQLPAGLTHYWKFDESAGSSYTDLVSGFASATCVTCPTPVAGRIGGAQQFDGTTDEINVADDNTLDWANGDRFSVEAWIRHSSACSVTGETVVGRQSSTSALNWSLGCAGSNATFTLIDTTGAGAVLVGATSITDNKWHHLVAMRDPISGTNLLYVDGVVDASASVSYAGGFGGGTSLNIGWLNETGSDYHFAGTIDELAIHDRVLPDNEIRRHYADGTVGLQRGYWGCEAPVNVMPLGDSNTRHWNPGFRPGLYFNLIGAGMDVDMVGSANDSCAPNCSHDSNNEGHSGHTPTNIANNISTWLSLNPPDVITLHIGTNVDPSFPYPDVTEVGAILDTIKGYDPSIPVVLARIINKARASYDPALSVFNQNLEALAQGRIAAGDRILVVDQEPVLDYSGSTTDFTVGDDLHPTASGYAKMVPIWFEGLNRFMPACNSVMPMLIAPPATTASSGVPYVDVVEATGVPAPTFSLTVAPAGMTIHPDTGRIEWIPPSAGDYDLSVRVSNLVGSGTQSFTIVVD